jgi:aminoglycoside phosphotransferase (APT) family kinase protein
VTASAPPPAEGVRIAWDALPERVRAAIEGWLGSRVVEAATQPGGFSPGVASRLRAEDGRRVFVKAVSPASNPDSPRFHRREARIAGALPPSAPVPRLLWTYDEGPEGWIALVYEDVEGRHPRLPWQPAELDRVIEAMALLAESLTPSPVPKETASTVASWLSRHGRGWQRFLAEPLEGRDDWSIRHAGALAELEARAPDLAQGDTLCHFDIRADNVLLTPDRVYVVDWPHGRIGQPWLDLIWFAPSVAMQGGPPPEAVVARHPAARAADPLAISASIAAIAGYFIWQSVQPPPPGLPTVRRFQAAQGEVARRWLAERTGWR